MLTTSISTSRRPSNSVQHDIFNTQTAITQEGITQGGETQLTKTGYTIPNWFPVLLVNSPEKWAAIIARTLDYLY